MTPALVIADCLPGFVHPPGHLELCVPIAPPQVVPTLETWALIALLVIVCATGLAWIWKRGWSA